MTMKVYYHEGDCFAVPLRDHGFGVGVVARANPNGVLLGYFFGPRRTTVPSVEDLTDLTPDLAVVVGRFGDLGLLEGTWKILGQMPGWHRASWPMPVFFRHEELTGRSFKVSYDADDPPSLVREEQVKPGLADRGPRSGLMGAGFVEKVLATRLG